MIQGTTASDQKGTHRKRTKIVLKNQDHWRKTTIVLSMANVSTDYRLSGS